MSRPKSVTTLAILQLISSIFVLLRCIILLLIGGVFGLVGIANGGEPTANFSTILIGSLIGFTIITVALGIFYFFLVRGLFGLKKWAWIGTAIVNVLILMIDGIMLFGRGMSVNFLTIGFVIAIFYYLMQPEVKRSFGI